MTGPSDTSIAQPSYKSEEEVFAVAAMAALFGETESTELRSVIRVRKLLLFKLVGHPTNLFLLSEMAQMLSEILQISSPHAIIIGEHLKGTGKVG